MKICVTAKGKSLDSEVESRFGRSLYFIIWDTEEEEFEAIENKNVSVASGVGIKSAQLIVDKNVKVVLTGMVGPKASDVLDIANIEVVRGADGIIVKEAIDNYINKGGGFTETLPQKDSNWFARTFQRCFGRSRGMGCRGRGAGIGQGQGRCSSFRA